MRLLPRCLLGLGAALVGLSALGASAQPAPRAPAVYKDAERFAEPGYGSGGHGRPGAIVVGPAYPVRRTMNDETYVGSEYGLSKPSYNGIGSRPDWGRSSR